MNRSRLVVTCALMVSLIATPTFAAVKAGDKCSKAGATATAGGKKYTCIKSGTKLVWNKGVASKSAIKPADKVVGSPSTEAPNPEQKGKAKNLLALDQRITPKSELTSTDICKTTDQTPEYGPAGLTINRNGFPRPTETVYGKSSARVLVIPMSFNDLRFLKERNPTMLNTKSDLELLEPLIPWVQNAFKDMSEGRFSLQIEVLPQKDWWIFNQNHPMQGGWGVDNFPKVVKLIEEQKTSFNFSEYDAYVFLTGNGTPGQSGLGGAQAQIRVANKNGKNGFFNAVLMVGSWSYSGVWVHELGHALYAFEDLYLFDQQLDPGKSVGFTPPNEWDLMANANLLKLMGWNKFLMGWLKDSEIRCITNQQSTVHYLSRNMEEDQSQLLTINLSQGVTLTAEARKSSESNSGLLLSWVNTHIDHGHGPVLTPRFLLSKGESKNLLGWRISVIDTDSDGILIETIKTDIEKFVAPAPKPQQSGQGQSNSTIKVAKNDLVSIGNQKARGIWEVSGQKSFRVYVTAVDDFQKVFFESGFVNDNRSTLEIEITGLVCNRALRTMVEFYSEMDGKGEKLALSNMNLSYIACQDVTKRP